MTAIQSNLSVSKDAKDGSSDKEACWICGSPADSREHKTKRSDLKAAFGKPTQDRPLFFHDRHQKNRHVKSLNADLLKYPDRICHFCNTTRTQPHDLAWEELSKFLLEHPSLSPGATVRFNRVFSYEFRRQMLNVHLFFVKVFGCLVLEGNLRIDMADFSASIMKNKPHPNIHLKFGRPSSDPVYSAGRSDVWAWPPTADAPAKFATWFYSLPHVWVNVMFATPGEKREGLIDSWHPSDGKKSLLIADFRYADQLRAAGDDKL